MEAWKRANGHVENGPSTRNILEGDFEGKLNSKFVVSVQDVLNTVNTGNAQICDMRSAARFNCEAPEPRPGVEGGNIPGSLNLPFSSLLKDESTFKTATEMKDIIESAGLIFGSKTISSCGSGVTASVLVVAMHVAGVPLDLLPIYDGSWSEWGQRKDLPKIQRNKI